MVARALILLLASSLLAPAAADAASVSVKDGVLHVVGDAGREWLSFDQLNGGAIAISNGGYPLTAGDGCVQGDETRVSCSPTGVVRALIELGGGDDQYGHGRFPIPARVEGGPGDDTLYDNDGPEEFLGGEGDDVLWMDSGPDAGADVLWGGPGNDQASYGQWRGDGLGLSLSLDDVANDGVPGEGDNIHTDIEALNGGYADDLLIGTPGDDELDGRTGDDELRGLGGDDLLLPGNEINAGGEDDTDRLFGGDGFDVADYSESWDPVVVSLDGVANDGAQGENDLVGTDIEGAFGGYGDDVLTGNAGDGLLDGFEGDDRIVDSGGQDLLAGGEDDDEIEAADGASDTVLCGDGADRVWRDPADELEACESATTGPRTAGPEPTPTPTPIAAAPTPRFSVPLPRTRRTTTPPPDATPPTPTVLRVTGRARMATLRRLGLAVTVRCSELCRAKAELKGRRGVVATATRAGLSFQERRLRLKLSRSAKRALRPGVYQLTITLTDRAGNASTVVRSLRVQ